MANNNGQFGISNPNGDTFVDFKTDPVGVANAFTAGVTSGFKVRASDPAGLSVTIGGETGIQDSAIIKSSAGIIYPVGNNTGDAVTVEVPAPSSTNPRIDSVVLSVDTTATTSELNGNDLVSIDIVSGTASSSPVAPSSSDIASEIGSGRAFVVLANITTPASASVIIDGDIATADVAKLGASNVDFKTSRMPIKVEEFVIGYGLKPVFVRSGDIVTVNRWGNFGTNPSNNQLKERIPVGWRPKVNSVISFHQVDGNGGGIFYVDTDGGLTLRVQNVTTQTSLGVTGCWVTQDDFPS